MKRTLGAFAVAASLAVAGAFASTPVLAASADGKARAQNSVQSPQAVSDTDISAHRRHWRHRHFVRPWPPVYPYAYGYYRPRPVFYRPYYYNPYPVYHRPFYRPHYWGGPVLSIGFGPRYYW